MICSDCGHYSKLAVVMKDRIICPDCMKQREEIGGYE
jgi:formylmethanofuran dehydrogenase subunit E